MLEFLCHSEVGVVMEALLDEVNMGRIALSCHFSLDVLCDKVSIISDHIFGENLAAIRMRYWYERDFILKSPRRVDMGRVKGKGGEVRNITDMFACPKECGPRRDIVDCSPVFVQM